MSLKMKGHVLDELVKRLRSGDYMQGQSALRAMTGVGQSDRFCCLGVLSEMAVEQGVVRLSEPDENAYSYKYVSLDGRSEVSAYLHPDVIEWAGIVSDIEKTVRDETFYEERGQWGEDSHCTLSVMNDSGSTFDDIANWLEGNVVRV